MFIIRKSLYLLDWFYNIVESVQLLITAIRNTHSIESTSSINLASNNSVSNCTFALFGERERVCAGEKGPKGETSGNNQHENRIFEMSVDREKERKREKETGEGATKKQIKKCRWIGSQ